MPARTDPSHDCKDRRTKVPGSRTSRSAIIGSVPETVLFNRYRLIEAAGRGGSAEVWRAFDEETGEEVAVKRLHPIVFADEAGRRRLQREFDALRSLDEPHIVRVRDLRFGEREAALVLDFVPGESLAQRLARQAADGVAMAPDAAVAIVDDIAAALAAAHAAGIVHRDVTPGNILLTLDGEARLTDFGISHGGGDAAAVTATGLLMGTMRYLAPEQLRGASSTPASDLHALAAVAYEMLTGRPAYEATSPVALADAQQAGPPPIEGIPAGLDAAVRQGLAVDPDDRPVDVRAFAASLTTALAAGLADQATMAIPLEPRDRTAVIALPVGATGAAAGIGAAAAGSAVGVGAAAAGAAGAAVAVLAAGVPGSVSAFDDVGVALPSRSAAAHGPFPAAAAQAERSGSVPARPARRRGRGLPAPVALVLGLLVAVGLLVAATGLDHAAPVGASATARPTIARDPLPTVRPSVSIAPSPSPSSIPGKGKGNGDEKGHGKGNGD